VRKSLFNPFTREFRENPYKTYAALQQQPPEYCLGMWVLTRYADVMAVLKDGRFSSALVPQIAEKRIAEFSVSCPEVSELGRKSIVFTDNPDHARLRRLTNLVFNSENIASTLKPIIDRLACKMCDEVCHLQSVDVIAVLAEPLPLKTLTTWMGLPDEAGISIKQWTNDLRFFLEPGTVSKQRFLESYRSLLDFMAFFRAEIRARKNSTARDFITMLLSAALDGDSLTEDEIIYACMMAFVAGSETTKALLGNATFLFALYPDQLELVHDGRVGVQNASNELFRYESPLQMTKRLCLDDLTIAGVSMKKGDQVLLCMGAANHDASVFQEPEKFMVDRRNSRQHLAFGYGFHSCLGAYLARLQIESYLNEIISRRMTFSMDGEPQWIDHSLILRGLKRLDVKVHAGVAAGVP
jgi:cytochrome P450